MTYYTRLVLTLVLSSFFSLAKASPQAPDYLIYKGDTMVTYHLLVEEYLQAHEKPDNGRLFDLSFRENATLNCWRGYQAIYTIEHDSLFVQGFISYTESTQLMNNIFGDKVVDGRVFIDWFSGDITIPIESMLRWDGVFHTTFEKETLFRIEKGTVRHTANITNYEDDPLAINRRHSDQEMVSDLIFEKLKSIEWKEKYDCSEVYYITIGKNGKVKQVSMAEYPTRKDIREYWERPEYNYCIKSIKAELKDLRFDIIKDKGQPIEEDLLIDIWIEEDGTIENLAY